MFLTSLNHVIVFIYHNIALVFSFMAIVNALTNNDIVSVDILKLLKGLENSALWSVLIQKSKNENRSQLYVGSWVVQCFSDYIIFIFKIIVMKMCSFHWSSRPLVGYIIPAVHMDVDWWGHFDSFLLRLWPLCGITANESWG